MKGVRTGETREQCGQTEVQALLEEKSQPVKCWETRRLFGHPVDLRYKEIFWTSWELFSGEFIHVIYATTGWKTNPALLATQWHGHNRLKGVLWAWCPPYHISSFSRWEKYLRETLDLCRQKGIANMKVKAQNHCFCRNLRLLELYWNSAKNYYTAGPRMQFLLCSEISL